MQLHLDNKKGLPRKRKKVHNSYTLKLADLLPGVVCLNCWWHATWHQCRWGICCNCRICHLWSFATQLFRCDLGHGWWRIPMTGPTGWGQAWPKHYDSDQFCTLRLLNSIDEIANFSEQSLDVIDIKIIDIKIIDSKMKDIKIKKKILDIKNSRFQK